MHINSIFLYNLLICKPYRTDLNGSVEIKLKNNDFISNFLQKNVELKELLTHAKKK